MMTWILAFIFQALLVVLNLAWYFNGGRNIANLLAAIFIGCLAVLSLVKAATT